MVGFLITGHGNFASGIISAVELVAGRTNRLVGVDFLESCSTDDLEGKLLDALEELQKDYEEILILSDLTGGSPYNQSVMIKMENPQLNIEVISGSNFPMVIAGIFDGEDMTLKELTHSMIAKGRESINCFVPKPSVKTTNNEREVGI
ncbi:PTS fructose transporter subunit IIA [Lacrimispora sp.]|uniref:PTS sugar transporter subunit IIA domain-containing protein n=1 Tax=Lacrimispora sp. TaxID=2719234 RepID=UPI0028A66DF0|nr:PTS fructose transporter subunit IIA [Lacrimispora sp.]